MVDEARREAIGGHLVVALNDFLIDSLAVTIRDVGQGGNLEMHTCTVDMFVFGGVEGCSCEGGLHQILVVLAT